MKSPPPAIALLCAAEIAGMLGFGTFSALLPTFLDEWALSNTQAGWINGIFYAGYLLAVPVLVSLTDRVEVRPVYLASTLAAAVSSLGFALWADGFWSALPLRALAGAALAGTYMPGLKALADRIEGPAQSRAVAFYTASFSIGASLSFFAAGVAAEAIGWRGAFAVAAGGPAVAAALIFWGLPPAPGPARPPANLHLLDFRPVLRNRRLMAFVLAYAAHNWELFGMRSWLVAFLVFSAGLQAAGASWWSAPTIAALVNLLGVVGSIGGNEIAQRLGRRRFVIGAMAVSAVVSAGFGFAAPWPYIVVIALAAVYGLTVSWDSSAITAGIVADADPALRGASMAVQSCVGFLGAFLGPLAFGIVLDLAGGNDQVGAWGFAFASLAGAVALGARK